MTQTKRWYSRSFNSDQVPEICNFLNYHGLTPEEFKVCPMSMKGKIEVLYWSAWDLGGADDSGLRKFGEFFIQVWDQKTLFLIPNHIMARLKNDPMAAIKVVRQIFKDLHNGSDPISMMAMNLHFAVEFSSGTKDKEFSSFALGIELNLKK